jgi:ceramide glucosyltransferase
MNTFPEALRYATLLVAAAALGYYAAATFAALRFFRRERAKKIPESTPPASVLKPVHGVDFGSYENFASFCRQAYPEYEILFAVNDDADPAVPLIRQLIQHFPERHIRLFVGSEYLGANRKVNNLAWMAQEARHEILVFSDGDVRVGPNFLREVVAPLGEENVGAVTCFYRSIAEKNLGAELEAVGAASDFFAGVLMANWVEGIRFALGAAIATKKSWLEKIGGFAAFSDMLADDYELGNRIAKAGGQVVLSREIVWTMYPAQTARSFWQHQLRWARTVRLCRPLSYFGLLLTHGLPWALLAAVVAPARWIAIAYLSAYLLLRLVTAWTVGVWGVGDDVLRRRLWLVPLRDFLNFIVWLASFASNRITWSGKEYIIRRGRMIPVDKGEVSARPSAAARP